MKKQDFLNELADIMQLDKTPIGTEKLKDFAEWDSMSNLGVISMFDLEFGITLKPDDLNNIKTITELMAIASDKITE